MTVNNETFSGTIGILGGGQLAMMLAQAAEKLDLKVKIFSEHDQVPAKLTKAEFINGKLTNPDDLKKFFSQVDLVTIENEFLPFEIIEPAGEGKDFLPKLETIEIAQNKLNQKFLFQKFKIPTANFVAYDSKLEKLDTWLDNILKKFPNGCVLKWAQGGYDGKGNLIFKNKSQLKEATQFCQKNAVYAEEFINFKNELAMIYVRSTHDEFVFYPLVISEQEKNICRTVYGPAVEFGISQELELQAGQIGKKIADELDFYGTFAIEFFLTSDNKLLVNEMAPRVHNSGHYTQDTYKADQFENHLRAITGHRIVAPDKKILFMMRNLLGPEEQTLDLPNRDLGNKFPISSEIKTHWYGKTSLAPWRKMGHLNLTFKSPSEVESKKKALIDAEQKIWQNIR